MATRGADVRVLPPLIFVAAFLAAWLVDLLVPWHLPGHRALTWVGAGGLVASVALMGWAGWTMTRHRTTIVPWGRPSAFVTAGPYRFTRNPIYLADIIAFLGGTALLGSLWPLLLLPVAILILRRIVIDREEAYLAGRFGDAYEDYRSRVRRFI